MEKVLGCPIRGFGRIQKFSSDSVRASDNPKSFSVQNESTISFNTSTSVFFPGGLYLHRHKSTCGGNGKNFPWLTSEDIMETIGEAFFRDEWSMAMTGVKYALFHKIPWNGAD